MIRVRRSGVVLVLLAMLAAGQGTLPGQERVRDIRKIPRVAPRINAPRPGYPVGEPVVIQLILHNPSDVPVTVEEECLKPSSFHLRVAGGKEKVKARKDRGKGPLTVPGGRTLHRTFNLRRHFKPLKKPGHYWISWSCGGWKTPLHHIFVVEPYDPERDRAAIIHTALGDLELALMPEQAPLHVQTFVQLARQGYYNGLSFDKMIPSVQIEVADRSESAISRWDQQLPPEIDRSITPGRGLVGAVRREGTESTMTSATRFFILLDSVPMMSGKHTWFGYVRKGVEVLQAFRRLEILSDAGGSAWKLREPVLIEKVEIIPE